MLTAWYRRSTPGHCQAGLSHSTTQKPVRVPEFASGLAPFRLPLPTLGRWNRDFGLREEPPLGPAGLHPGRGSPTLGSLPTVPVCRVDLPARRSGLCSTEVLVYPSEP